MEIGIVAKPAVWLWNEDHTEVTDELLMGWAVGILQEESGWLKVVTHYGYSGYLRKENICFSTQNKLRRRDESGQTVFISRGFADIMKEPKVHSRILTTLSKGSFVSILPELRDGYRRVRLPDGQEGYVPCISYECRKESDSYLYEKERSKVYIHSEEIFREQLVAYGKGYLGTQYRWGGKSAEGVDCSGFTFMCYLMNGVLIYRDAKMKPGYPVHPIFMEQLKPGDLLYFPGHIAMYIGNQRYIHATGNAKSFGCVINSLSKEDLDYRPDLAETLLTAGSIF